MTRLAALLIVLQFGVAPALAQSASGSIALPSVGQLQNQSGISWKAEEVTDGSSDKLFEVPVGEVPPNGLPDGRIATPDVVQDIARAWYSEPTGRYRHGVLGDAVEAGALVVETPRGQRFFYRLPRTEVFEDITPRIADLDRDGRSEVIAIVSDARRGASVAVFGLNGESFTKRAQSNFIGQANRWLNIAGIAPFTGSGELEIAVVETPHLRGLLKYYRMRGTSLQSTRSTPGFSNHAIGSRELQLSAVARVDDDRKPDLVLPSLDRRTLYAVSLGRAGLKLLARTELPAAIEKRIVTQENGPDLKIHVRLESGQTFLITRVR